MLTVHLKRFEFGGFGHKINKRIEFSLSLDLAPFMSDPRGLKHVSDTTTSAADWPLTIQHFCRDESLYAAQEDRHTASPAHRRHIHWTACAWRHAITYGRVLAHVDILYS